MSSNIDRLVMDGYFHEPSKNCSDNNWTRTHPIFLKKILNISSTWIDFSLKWIDISLKVDKHFLKIKLYFHEHAVTTMQ